ncbi:MAG: carboxypeptidase-like regulatory domain-containing protein [Bacteroidales bacterium]|nr:carboxypeptidase-like regulatory domain-containing protein [Bacteroidales bacterium]MDD3891602.1 carboxypeptidase-like regulatory domain-containing protein [Bacteroidales bacterium]
MRKLILPFLVMTTMFAFGQTDSVTISGKVTDFNGQSIEGALIMIKGYDFGQFVDTTFSDKTGHYSLLVKKGKYSGLAAVRMEDYSKTKLEFWAYEIPAYKNLDIDIRYDRLEVYGVNIFQVQGAYPGYTIYFRPMSLARFATADMSSEIIDIAPPSDMIDIKVNINGDNVNVNSIQRVEEFSGKQKMYAYLIHTDLEKPTAAKYSKFQIIVEDKENGDKGEAIYFKEKVKYE